MTLKRGAVVFLALLCLSGGAAEWRNLDEEHHLGGRMASGGYLLGKVVLVDRWGAKCPPCCALLPRMEELWRTFKGKQFVLLGGHCAGWGSAAQVKKLIAANKLTYPVYEDAGLAENEPAFESIPFLYVLDATGRVIYVGHDERLAREAIVNALTDLDAPRSLAQWKRFLDFELENLPGRAYLRMNEFKKSFPKEAQEYAEKFRKLAANPEARELAAVVDFAKKAKDTKPIGPKDGAKKQKLRKLIETVLSKGKDLRGSADPRVAQEAKNAIADLTWKLATLK